MEIFITDRQKLLNLPCEESQWSLAFSTSQTRQDVTEHLIKRGGDWIIPASTIPSVILEEDAALKEVSDSAVHMNGGFKGQLLDGGKNIVPTAAKHVITGRTGEVAAFKYFSAKLGEKFVKWVNEFNESGLPYDIVIEGENNSKEYIEVKATSHAWKDWFGISIREWQFAVEKGDSFSIARVVISDGNSAQITTYRNPAKLCQLKQIQLQLALQPPKQ